MIAMIKITIAVLAIFLVAPLTVIAISWGWSAQSLNESSRYLFWITESAGSPWAILTSIFFLVLFSYVLANKTKKVFIKLALILILAIAGGQIVKSAIKNYVGESRPFVLWMESKYALDGDYFYSVSRNEREDIIHQYVNNTTEIPHWLYHHWRNETGYAFPSGHTLFATTWAFLALVLLNVKRHYLMIALIIAWAVIIEVSRLALGMHHPLDLVVGSFLAWLIALLAYYFAVKWHIIENK